LYATKSAAAKKTAKNFRWLKPFPKAASKIRRSVDFHEANPLISTHKAFSRSWVAGFRAAKLTAVAGKNLTRDERV